ncbi:hypothetical protein CFC21_082770 [Triticum aestivum]|uniref:Uncharacterized protein n=2 Tax=Triticum aestivum TaxID=4565 RepID=A0A3B6NNQ1_WHEAT|nr:uncharacterized protein LOC123132378 isoform X1 [Triticum aestivum]KAF7078312.1 hypothetical protein CFC21_082770 [Triticum aestivum]
MDRSCGPFSKHDANGKLRFDNDKKDLSDLVRNKVEFRPKFQREQEEYEYESWGSPPTSYKEEERRLATTTPSRLHQTRSDDALDPWLKARDDGFSILNDNPRSESRLNYINSSKNNAHGDQCKDGSSGRGIVPRPPPAKGWSTSGVPSERSGAGSEVGAEESDGGAWDGVAPGTSGAGDEVGAVPEANILSVPVDAWTCHQDHSCYGRQRSKILEAG